MSKAKLNQSLLPPLTLVGSRYRAALMYRLNTPVEAL